MPAAHLNPHTRFKSRWDVEAERLAAMRIGHDHHGTRVRTWALVRTAIGSAYEVIRAERRERAYDEVAAALAAAPSIS